MQRQVASSARTNEDDVIINVPPQSPHVDPRRRTDQESGGGGFDDLSAMEAGLIGDGFNNRRNGGRGMKSRFGFTATKWINAIPLIVLLCLFVLWWCSYPVEIRDGRVLRIRGRHEFPIPRDEDRIDFTFLSVAASPPYAASSSFSHESSDNTSYITSSADNETRADITFLEMTTSTSLRGSNLQEPSGTADSPAGEALGEQTD